MIKRLVASLFIALFFYSFSVAQPATDTLLLPKLTLDFPVLDFPYQMDAKKTVGKDFFAGYANPSMSQSLALSADVFSGFHYGMKAMGERLNFSRVTNRLIESLGTVVGDFLLGYAPGGDGWLHEEYHRAVMTRFGVNSFNDMNTFPLGAELVSVNHLKDEDLERFKAAGAHDFIRMHVAGIEGQYRLVERLQRTNFFYEQHLSHEFLYLVSTLNSILYVMESANPKSVDVDVDEMNSKELTMAERDFTGYDMTSWAYDLFHPNEPYRDRGVHPSGEGLNRYRKTTDLEDNELKYLKQRGYWQWTNVLSPMLIGIRSIPLGKSGLKGNFAVRHLLTSFGTDLSLNVFLKKSQYNVALSYHNYRNYDHTFPAIEVEMLDYPASIGNHTFLVSPRVLTGVQPLNQHFMTSKAELLALAGGRIDFMASKNWLPYVEVLAKTDGWVAGNEFLTSNVSIRIGLSARFY